MGERAVAMKSKLKQFVQKNSKILNAFPFNNRIKLNGNFLTIDNSFLWKCKIVCKGSGNNISISEGAILQNCNIIICGNDNEVRIGSGTAMKQTELWIEDDENKIIIGNDTKICGKTHLACIEGCTISIGNDCLFSSDIIFRTGDSHSILNQDGERINSSESICVKNHVWIGHHVTLLKGITIESDSVIGTGSIITKSIKEKNVVIAGTPAKIVKRNVNWCAERR